jgi:hypothetical protein
VKPLEERRAQLVFEHLDPAADRGLGSMQSLGRVPKPPRCAYRFAEVTSDSADLARIADGIGQRWEVLNNAYKPYPCGVVLFLVIDACLELPARLASETEAIDHVVVRGHPLMRERTDRPNVEAGRDAKVSLTTPSPQRSFLALPGSRNTRTIAPPTRPCARCAQGLSSKKIRAHRSSRRP